MMQQVQDVDNNWYMDECGTLKCEDAYMYICEKAAKCEKNMNAKCEN